MIESKEISNPFPGLRPFETDEYRLFFGREGQSDTLIARLQRSHFLAVVGTSGSGKSSLVRAGMLPALRGGMMAGAGSGWRIAIMRPGSDPIGNLASTLADQDVLLEAGGGLPRAEAEAVIEATLRRGALGLIDAARQARLSEHEKLLVVVDQFEELFRFRAARAPAGTGDDASAFVKLLLEAAQQRELSIYVVPTMRSDFLGDCAQFQGLPEAINDGQYLIPRMTRDERRFAITGPVGVRRRKITEPLVNRLMNDVGDNPDQLPILQHALMRTWDYWAAHRRNGEPIGLEHYQAIGAMSDALSLHADEAFKELPDERGRSIAERLFKALTERGADNREIRRPTSLRAICEIADASLAEAGAVIEVFRGGGRSFLMPPSGVALDRETVIDISHESLIRNWQRLQTWVNEEAQSARVYRRLVDAAMLHGEGVSGLWYDPALQLTLDWRDQARPNWAWAARYHDQFDVVAAFPDADGAAERHAQLFDLAMTYLEESRLARDSAVAERERQRNAELERERRDREQAETYAAGQARAARRLRWLAAGIAVMFLIALATAAFAMAARNKAKASEQRARDAQQAAQKSERDAKDLAANLQTEKDKTDRMAVNLGREKKKTDEALIAERKALDSQKQATKRANDQKLAAENSQRDAQTNFVVAMISKERSARHLSGIAEYQRGSYDQAFQTLTGAMEGVDYEENASKSVNYPSLEKKDIVMNELKSTRSSLLRDIAATQRKLGKYEDAVRSYTKALQLQTEYDANTRIVWGKTPSKEQERRLRVTWDMFDSTYGLAQAYRDLADANSPIDKTKDNEDYLKAEDYYKQALALQENLLHREPNVSYSVDSTSGETILEGKQALKLAGSLEELARFYRDLHKYEEAEPVYKRVLEMRDKQPDRTAYRATLTEVGKFYAEQLKYQEAEAMFEKAIEGLGDKGTGADLMLLPDMYNNLGEVYGAQEGKESKAKAALQFSRALRDFILIYQQVSRNQGGRGESVSDAKPWAAANESLADAYAGLGNYKQAAQFYESAGSMQLVLLDMGAFWRLAHKQAELNRERLQDYAKAEEQYKALVDFASENPDNGYVLLPQALRELGSLYANEMNRPAEAEPLLKRSLELSSKARKGTYPPLEVNKALAELARLYRRQNRNAEMEKVQEVRAENAGKILSDALGPVSTLHLAASSSYTEAAREYLEANGELAARYWAQHKEDDLLAFYKAMLGDTTKQDSNPASCCIRIDNLVLVPVFVLYSKTLEDYRQLLLARGMKEEAAKIAEYINRVEQMQEEAKKYQSLFQ